MIDCKMKIQSIIKRCSAPPPLFFLFHSPWWPIFTILAEAHRALPKCPTDQSAPVDAHACTSLQNVRSMTHFEI